MINIALPDELARQLEEVSRRENRPVAEIIKALLTDYESKLQPEQGDWHPLDAFIGIYDDDITDMSISVRQTIRDHFQRKNERTD